MEDFDQFLNGFLEGDLGKIYSSIPWKELVSVFGLNDAQKGPASIFGTQGTIALMFLKHYAGCSDRRLVDQLNGNIAHQFFCGIHLEKIA